MAEVTAFRNNALPYPVYGVPYTIVFPILDADGDPVTGATCDSEISKNGDTAVDCTNEGTEITFTTATNKGMYYLTLTAAEMTADIVAVTIYPDSGKATPIVLYPRKLVTLASGTSQGGAVGYITLAASTVDFDDQFNGCLCVATIDSNVEARVLQACTSANQQCTVTPDWNVAPDADDTYIVYLPEGMQIPQANVKAWVDVLAVAGAIPAAAADAAGGLPVSDAGELDMDIALQNGLFAGGTVWVDPSGTNSTAWPYGSAPYPTSTIANGKTIADALNIQRINITGVISLSAAMEGYDITGSGNIDYANLININSQSIEHSTLRNLVVTGATGNAALITDQTRYTDCLLNTHTNINGVVQGGSVGGACSVLNAAYALFIDVFFGQGAACTLTLNAPTKVDIINMRGILTISGMTGGTCNITLTDGSFITIDNTCTGGTITLTGIGSVTDNSNGSTVVALADTPTVLHATTDAALLAYVQLLARNDAAIGTDNATELAAINADGGSGGGDYNQTTDAQEGLATSFASYAASMITLLAAVGNIEADTNELQTNQGNWLTATGFSTHAAADVAALLNDPTVAQIWAGLNATQLAKFLLVDTGETSAAAGSVGKIAQGSAGGNVTVEDFTQAALAKFANTDTGETTTVDGSVSKLSQGGTAAGAGAIEWTIRITDDGGTPLDGVEVWASTDSAGSNVVASGSTDASGDVTLMLDAGTYYIWRQLAGYDFTNPQTTTVA